MSIYKTNGSEAAMCYEVDGNECFTAYSKDADIIYHKDAIDNYLPNRTLLFEDNFDGSSLNDDNWSPEIGYVRGAHFHSGQNVSVANGNLVLSAKKENRSTSGWTIGSVLGSGRKGWMYGRFEAKIKTDGLIGSFGAFWGLSNSYKTTPEKKTNESGVQEYQQQLEGDTGGVTWPESGEFDIIEMIPGNTSRPPCNLWDANGDSLGNQNFFIDIDITDWHVYAMEWTPQYIAMLIDNIEYKRWTFSDYSYNLVKAYMTEPMSLIITQGEGTAAGQTAEGITEHKMYCDWVRVYAPLGFTEDIPVTSIAMPSTFSLKKGYKKYMCPTISPLTATNRNIVWASSDNSVLAVDHGMMYGVNYGTAILVAITENGKIAICEVTVVDSLT